VKDVTSHPSFNPLIDIRTRIYDIAHDPATRGLMTVEVEAGGVITRVGDETIGEMWSLADGKNVLNEIDPRFSENMSGTSPTPTHRTHSTFPPTLTPRVTAQNGRSNRTQIS
jgi:hypothetical protein